MVEGWDWLEVVWRWMEVGGRVTLVAACPGMTRNMGNIRLWYIVLYCNSRASGANDRRASGAGKRGGLALRGLRGLPSILHGGAGKQGVKKLIDNPRKKSYNIDGASKPREIKSRPSLRHKEGQERKHETDE